MTGLPPVPGTRRAAVQRAHTVLVAGVSGGTGTTTVAALLVDAAGARRGAVVQASDHSGGELASRLPRLDPASTRDAVHDAGAHVLPAAHLAAAPENALVVVGRASDEGAADAVAALDTAATADPSLPARTVVVLVDRTARGTAPDLGTLRARGVGAVVVLPRDPALGRPGRIDPGRFARATVEAAGAVLTALRW